MSETALKVAAKDGTADAYLYRPDSGGPFPGVVCLTDIAGIRPTFQDMARRLSEKGYAVLLPNIFYRVSKLPVFDFPAKMGDERTMKRLGELRAGLNNQQAADDGGAYIDALFAQPGVRPGKAGIVGYCFTGAMAMRSAAIRPNSVAAAASFHGGGLCSDQPDSPHLLLSKIKARLYFGHAVEDRSMPAEAIAKLETALKTWGGRYENETYEGAHHGWTVPGSPIYNEKQAERHFVKLVELFDQTLK